LVEYSYEGREGVLLKRHTIYQVVVWSVDNKKVEDLKTPAKGGGKGKVVKEKKSKKEI